MKVSAKKILYLLLFCLNLNFCNSIVLEDDPNSNKFRENLVQALKSHKVNKLAIPAKMNELSTFLQDKGFSVLSYNPDTVSPQFFSFHKFDFALMHTTRIDNSFADISSTLKQFGQLVLVDLNREQAKLVALKSGDIIRRDFSLPSGFFPNSKSEFILNSGKMLLLPYALDEGSYKFRILADNRDKSGAIVASVKYRLGRNGKNRQLVKTHTLAISEEVRDLVFSISEAKTPLRYYVELRFRSEIGFSEVAKIQWFEIEKL